MSDNDVPSFQRQDGVDGTDQKCDANPTLSELYPRTDNKACSSPIPTSLKATCSSSLGPMEPEIGRSKSEATPTAVHQLRRYSSRPGPIDLIAVGEQVASDSDSPVSTGSTKDIMPPMFAIDDRNNSMGASAGPSSPSSALRTDIESKPLNNREASVEELAATMPPNATHRISGAGTSFVNGWYREVTPRDHYCRGGGVKSGFSDEGRVCLKRIDSTGKLVLEGPKSIDVYNDGTCWIIGYNPLKVWDSKSCTIHVKDIGKGIQFNAVELYSKRDASYNVPSHNWKRSLFGKFPHPTVKRLAPAAW